ncbi:MAG: hypothetical protein F4Z40_02025 [Chloroflexi bacterium]|nr:hypothetical protein [Chloroflexota bacterium]
MEIDELAIAIDSASRRRDKKALLSLIGECDDQLLSVTGEDRVLLHYFRSNAFAGLVASHEGGVERGWDWGVRNKAQVLFSLRRATNEPDFQSINPVRACQIRTNLANWLSTIGRPIAANEQWLKALEIEPHFAKALVNRADGLIYYASAIYDQNQMPLIQYVAKTMLDGAIDEEAIWESGDKEDFLPELRRKRDELALHLDHIGFDEQFDLNQWTLGDTQEERDYRQWSLDERLFLNPLNDICTDTVASADVLHLPSHTYAIHELPRFPDYFNLLKHEFVCARYRLYKGMRREGPEFVVRDVLLKKGAIDQLLDFQIDELRAAYRSAYALFDKIALFVDEYFGLEVNPRAVTFRNVWFDKGRKPAPELKEVFRKRPNWVLRGLFFLSKDLFDKSFKDVAEPDALELARLRQQLEHRFLSLQHVADGRNTEFHLKISKNDFAEKALRLLKLAREALIYTSLAMHEEETGWPSAQTNGIRTIG